MLSYQIAKHFPEAKPKEPIAKHFPEAKKNTNFHIKILKKYLTLFAKFVIVYNKSLI